MTSDKKDFYGKEVAEAIKKACEKLKTPQEQLEIEVIETGSTGIFGLIRKKAHIRVQVKKADPPARSKKEASAKPEKKKVAPSKKPEKAAVEKKITPTQPEKEKKAEPEKPTKKSQPSEVKEKTAGSEEITEELSEEALAIIKEELTQVLDLMGYPSPVEVSSSGTSVLCHVGEEHEDILTGQDGKTLDSIQYLLRKIIARKVPGRLRLTVDIGNFREKRLAELKERAEELAVKVKADGKTQVIAALSPSERRVIHMTLQDDKEIRSRSVGDGLFKKILIYKPGKGGGKGSGRKRNSSRNRRGQNNRKKSE
jgi:spoIIIJ-associated protein